MAKKLPEVVKKALQASPALQQAYDDGVEYGRRDGKVEILSYIETLVMDPKIKRGTDEYNAMLLVTRKIAKKFK